MSPDSFDNVWSSPNDMALDNPGHHSHSLTKTHQDIHFHHKQLSSTVQTTRSPSLNPYFGTDTPIAFESLPYHIPYPQALPPTQESKHFFESVSIGDLLHDWVTPQIHENWPYLPSNVSTTSSWDAGSTWPYSSNSADTILYGRSGSVESRNALPLHDLYGRNPIPLAALLDDQPVFQSTPIITHEIRDIMLTEHLKVSAHIVSLKSVASKFSHSITKCSESHSESIVRLCEHILARVSHTISDITSTDNHNREQRPLVSVYCHDHDWDVSWRRR